MNTEDDFRALAQSSMRLSAALLDGLLPEQQSQVGGAIEAGARLVLEFGPLPDFRGCTLFLVEREGRRHRLGEFSIKAGRLQ